MSGQGRRETGTIYARGEALWVYIYQRGDRRIAVSKATGKQPGATTWRDAVDVLNELRDEKAVARKTGATVLNPKQRALTVEQLLTEYEKHRLIQGVKNVPGFMQAMKATRAWFGHCSATKLTTPMLEAIVQQRLEAGRARGTIKTRLHALYAALRWAKDRLPSIPAQPELSVPLTRKGTWSAEEVEQFCAVARPWLADVARFGYLTGWRIGEVLSLTWDRVDLKRGFLFLDETKTDDPRVRPIEGSMRTLLGRRQEARRLGCALVFHVDGLPIADGRFSYRWRQTLLAAELPPKLFHDFRRGIYDRLLMDGADLLTSMDLVGHKSLSSARRYARPNLARMQATLDRLDTPAGQHGPHNSRTAEPGSASSPALPR